jgi:hypothetical protein
MSQITEKDEVLIFYDAIMVDTVMADHSLHSEEFRALVTKFNLFNEPSLKDHIDTIVDKIWAFD